MRAILLTAVAGLALAGCDMTATTTANDTPAVVVDTPVTAPVVVAPATTAVVEAVADPAPLPIIGNWQCGSTGFKVTAGTYTTAGGAATRIASIDRASDYYRLTLQDGQKIRLSNITADRLTWTNEAAEGATRTGGSDAASCTRTN